MNGTQEKQMLGFAHDVNQRGGTRRRPERVNRIGQRYGRLLVVNDVPPPVGKYNYSSECKCDCGETIVVKNHNLANGHTKSCGCLSREATSKRNKTHGLAGTRIYKVWDTMRHRCNNPNNNFYHRYGGRGIKVCDRWNNSFRNFLSDMGDPGQGLDIDRINNDGDYTPDNCRWVTHKINTRNTSRTIKLEFKGEILSLRDFCEKLDLKYSKVYRKYVKTGRRVDLLIQEFDKHILSDPETIENIMAWKRNKPGSYL